MTTSRAVRIPRSSRSPRPDPGLTEGGRVSPPVDVPAPERRPNVGGSQRAIRLAALFVAVLALLYAVFILYDRTAPGGTSSPAGNGVLLFTGIFLVLAVGGAIFALSPAPRTVEVTSGRVTVVGRFGRRRNLPALEQLSVSVVRRYPVGWLSDRPVELIELSGEGVPRRTYLVDDDLFAGAMSAHPGK